MGATHDAVGVLARGSRVAGEDEAVLAAKRLHQLDHDAIRATFDRRWTARRMAEDYVELYERLARPAQRLHAVAG